MTLRIWGRANSINVQKVLWACGELGLAFERIDAGGAFGIVNSPEYKAMNPNSIVPAIDDDGFVLWESNAITRYLAAKHGAGTLWPSDLRVRALALDAFAVAQRQDDCADHGDEQDHAGGLEDNHIVRVEDAT